MKKYLFFAASALALASCSSDDFVGDNSGNLQSATTAINFGGEAGKTTRANQTGEDAAKALKNKFVVYGYKTVAETQVSVFDHYTITWNGNSGQTESNTKGWEYVGVKPNSLSQLEDQTIKYWDYSASQYDFIAFSFGEATQGDGTGKVLATKVTTDPKYTLAGDVTELAKCFIADRVTAKKNIADNNKKKANKLVGYKDDVQFNFRSLATKVTMGIYEIVPGYSIKDVKFYNNGTGTTTTEQPTLFAADKKIPSGNGTITVTFPTTDVNNTDYNKAHVSFAATGTDDMSSIIEFDALSLEKKEKAEEDVKKYIGRDITTVSTPKDGTNKKYETVIPAHVGPLTLKVDYTLVSIDGSKEEIKVKGATAVVPEVYTKWEPNYAYTYIFKISDKTNGSTGTPGTDPAGLYPITFDAVVTETSEGLQETITTGEKNSITTYAKGAINEEYKTGSNIYVSVNGKTVKKDATSSNVALYTATAAGTQTITEATVAHCLKSGATTGTEGEKTLTNGTDNVLTVTPTTATDLSVVSEIAADDAADGNAISGNFAKFTPANAGTYVFEFTDDDATKYYKVIIVK